MKNHTLTIGMLALLTLAGCSSASDYGKRCKAVKTNYENAQSKTLITEKTSDFVKNPLLSTEYLSQLRAALLHGATEVGDARDWFKSQDIPVSFTQKRLFYAGNEKYAELMQQLDDTHFILMRFRAGTGDTVLFQSASLVIMKTPSQRFIERNILIVRPQPATPE